MAYDRPLYHRSPPSPLGGYSIRFLLGLLCSLAIVLLLLHVPLSFPTEHVGWSTRPSERIPLSQIQQEESSSPEKKTDEETTTEDRSNTPPPTRHLPPVSEATSGTASENATGQKKAKKEPSDPSSRVRSIAALSTEDNHPEIVGGKGSLYLQIRYPRKARKKGIEGLLLLHFTVDENGNARRIDVTKSLHPLCDSAAVQALRSVKFRPGTQNGEPIPVRMSLPVRFKIRSTPKSEQNALRTNRLPSSGS